MDNLLITIIILIFVNVFQCIYTYSALKECPGTEVTIIRHQIELNEISLIFYYTQWSDESLEALKEFNDVAAYFGDKIYFAAINCWHLACNCSRTLSTTIGSGSPHKWPTLMVHYVNLNQLNIQYKGAFTFRDMVQFIMHIMHPLERIEEIQDLEKMKTVTDGIVLGVFKQPVDFEYKIFLMSALKWLEHDPLRTYRFTVTFDSVKEYFNESNVIEPNLFLLGYKTKTNFAAYGDFKWNVSHIIRWVHEEFNNDYNFLHGYNTPITIAEKMKKHQPVLAIFVNQPQQFFSYMEKYVDFQKPFTKALLSCENSKSRAYTSSWKELVKVSKFMENLLFIDNLKCYYHKDVLLKHLQYYYEINQYFKYKNYHDSAKSVYSNSSLEIRELLDFLKSTSCLLKQNIALQTSLHIGIVKRLEGYLANEQQLQTSNRSISVVLLDTERYKDYLENIDITPTYQSMATVFIIDSNKENIYLMEDRFAMFTLMEFVKNFYSGALNNYFKNNKVSTSSREYDIELKNLNRHILLNYLQHTHNQTLAVLIYSTDCALCSNIQHSFMQLSLSFRNIMDLKFIRINIMDNDLPWQLNMPFLPAFLVFPQNRFSESRLFPIHLKPDIRNVFGFILSQLSAHQQVKLVLVLCQSRTLPKSHTQSCWQFAKTILMRHIGKHLQYWQLFEAERTLIFDHLRAFNDMSIEIQSNLRL